MSDKPSVITDPMSACWAYRKMLTEITTAPTLSIARQLARDALHVTVETPRNGHVTVVGSFGHHTQQAIVSLSVTQLTTQMPIEDARKVAQDILDQAATAEQDGALVQFLRAEGRSDQQIGALISALRAFRARFRADLKGMGLADNEEPPPAPRTA